MTTKDCLLCGCDKSLHLRHGICRGVDDDGWECNCDSYESKTTSTSQYCDSCLTIAYDRVGHGEAEQVEFLDAMSADIEDHECDAVEEDDDDDIRCDCLAHRSGRR